MDNRLLQMADVLVKYGQIDFTEEMPVSKQRDQIDALSSLINMMIEDLSSMIVPKSVFNTLFNSVSNMVFKLDSNAMILDMNEAVRLKLGYSKKELIGKSIKYLRDPSMRPLPATILKKVIAGHKETQRCNIFKTRKNTRVLADITITPLPKSSHDSTRLLLIAEDLAPRAKDKLWAKAKTRELANTYGLTKRQVEIIPFVIKGLSSAEIGEKLCISKRTVDTHRENIAQKTDTHNPLELTRLIYGFQ
jgi:PAS domain S-box-containing protein